MTPLFAVTATAVLLLIALAAWLVHEYRTAPVDPYDEAERALLAAVARIMADAAAAVEREAEL